MRCDHKTVQATLTPKIEERDINPSGGFWGRSYFPVPGTAQVVPQSTGGRAGRRTGEGEGRA